MIVHNCEQGSSEWLALRAGIPTASEFHRILTAKKLEVSSQAPAYMHRLLAELITGRPIQDIDGDDYQSEWMKRGSDLERNAVAAYEFLREADTRTVGFTTTDDGTVGASPDRLIGEHGAVEIKCPSLAVHVGYMLNPQTLVDRYRLQVYGQLYVGRGTLEWDDLVSYHPTMPLVIVRPTPNIGVLELIGAALSTFVSTLRDARIRLEREYGPFTRPTAAKHDDPLGISDADVDAILHASGTMEA